MCEYKLIRKASIKKGKVILTFRMAAGDFLQRIYWNDGYLGRGCCTSTTLQERLSEGVFRAMTPEEIKESFGCLELPEEAKVSVDCIITPATRDAVRAVTARVTEWVRKGMERCQALHTARGMEDWLWEKAAAEPPAFRWEPVEE